MWQPVVFIEYSANLKAMAKTAMFPGRYANPQHKSSYVRISILPGL